MLNIDSIFDPSSNAIANHSFTILSDRTTDRTLSAVQHQRDCPVVVAATAGRSLNPNLPPLPSSSIAPTAPSLSPQPALPQPPTLHHLPIMSSIVTAPASLSVSIPPTSSKPHTPSPPSSPPRSSAPPTPVTQGCPFSRLAPAGAVCPITGALNTSALSRPSPPSPSPPSPAPTSPLPSPALVPPVEETSTALVVVTPRRRCPWWARLLRWSARTIAKRVVMRSLKPVFSACLGGSAHVLRNMRRGEVVAAVAAEAAGVAGKSLNVYGGAAAECPLGFGS